MNNLVTILDFSGRYTIPDQSFALDNFNIFISQKQYELLVNILGIELYNDFETNPMTQKWIDFVTGKTYTDYRGFAQNWQGIKSVLIPYIYTEYLEFNQYTLTNTGAVQANNQNSTLLTEFRLKKILYQNWNNFINMYSNCYMFLYTFASIYTEFYLYFKEYKKQSFIEKHSIR